MRENATIASSQWRAFGKHQCWVLCDSDRDKPRKQVATMPAIAPMPVGSMGLIGTEEIAVIAVSTRILRPSRNTGPQPKNDRASATVWRGGVRTAFLCLARVNPGALWQKRVPSPGGAGGVWSLICTNVC